MNPDNSQPHGIDENGRCAECEPDGDTALSAMAPTELDGATGLGNPSELPRNAGEFAARWNAMEPELREAFVHGMIAESRILALYRMGRATRSDTPTL